MFKPMEGSLLVKYEYNITLLSNDMNVKFGEQTKLSSDSDEERIHSN